MGACFPKGKNKSMKMTEQQQKQNVKKLPKTSNSNIVEDEKEIKKQKVEVGVNSSPVRKKKPKKKQLLSKEYNLDPLKSFPLLSILKDFPNSSNILAFYVNGCCVNINTILKRYGSQVTINPVYRNSIKGESILRRSFIFLMAKAIRQIEPDREWFVRHQVEGGYFCEFSDGTKPSKEFIENVQKQMLEMVDKELPITETTLYYKDAIEYLKEIKQPFALQLLQSINTYDVIMDKCDGFMNLHHRVLVYNTKLLKDFKLNGTNIGWVIDFSFKGVDSMFETPKEIGDMRIIQITKDQRIFNESCGVKCVGDINSRINNKTIDEFISLCNTFHERCMNTMVQKIRKSKVNIRLILIAGPSASGKTTFAKQLRTILQCAGINSHMISVDDYFKPNEECPIDEVTGDYDFESLGALRIDLLNDHLNKLFEGKEIKMPVFDFHKGRPDDNVTPLKIEENSVLIMEGIHCLNDKLTPEIEMSKKYKIFIAPLSPMNYDDRNFISNATFRLMRRIVRDYLTRGHSVQNTLFRWPSVRRAEHKYIFPYMNDANFIFNTAFDYEIGVLKNYVKPLLKSVKPTSEYFDDAVELLTFLDKFQYIPYKYVPNDSLLQEFIGGHWLN